MREQDQTDQTLEIPGRHISELILTFSFLSAEMREQQLKAMHAVSEEALGIADSASG